MTTLIFVYLDGFGFYIRKLLLLLYFPNRFLFSSNVENLGNISSHYLCQVHTVRSFETLETTFQENVLTKIQYQTLKCNFFKNVVATSITQMKRLGKPAKMKLSSMESAPMVSFLCLDYACFFYWI